MALDKIKKRNGVIVEFDKNRIVVAIEKAFEATSTPFDLDLVNSMTAEVIGETEERFVEKVPGVEDIQDFVERKINEKGFFDVAKAYIIYRNEHQRLREQEQQELLDRIAKSKLKVKKRDGTLVDFDVSQIEIAIRNCCQGFEAVDVQGIIDAAKLNLYDGIPTSQINQAVLMAIRGRIELDPEYSLLAARFLYNDLYKDVLGIDEFDPEFKKVHETRFMEKMKMGVDNKRLDPRIMDFDFTKIAAVLDPSRDKLFAYMGAQTLYDRYFLKDLEQTIIETPQYFWMRVAMGLSLTEKNKEAAAIEFYNAISTLRYVPSTPTLLHAGTHHPQMSSCYLNTVEDDLHHIFKVIGDNAQLSKWSGGIGTDWTNIRATGSLVKAINVSSQGVIPFLKIVDATTGAINRSGKRRGAACVYLETWHYDIEEYLDLRKNTGDDRRRTHDVNTANWIPDLFVKRVMADKDWTLFSPNEVPELHHIYGKAFETKYEEYEKLAEQGKIQLFKKVRALDLWRKMVTMLFETGHPWMTFKDPSNIRSPQDHVGVVHNSNLCTEITLNTSAEETAVCNLGSLNLIRHIASDRTLDRELLAKTVKTAMRMLDNVIDLNFYPTKEAETSNLRHRPVGLGIMGYQDLLYTVGLQFDSDEAVAFSDKVMEFVSYHAILTSSEIAKEKGAYSSFKGSKWDRDLFPIDTLKLLEEERGMSTGVDYTAHLDWAPVRSHVKQYGMRNSNCLAIAPTATIANISGCLPSIEPIYKNIYVKSNFSGDFTVVNRYLIEDLKKLNLWNETILEKLKYYDGSLQRITEIPEVVRATYKEVFEIDAHWIVRHAAYRGKWIDQSQSVNIFTSSSSGKFISDIYMYAWQMGMKTTYYLRTMAASSIEKSTIDINKNYTSPEVSVTPAVSTISPSSTPIVADLAVAHMENMQVNADMAMSPDVYISDGGICESCQ